MAGADLRRIFLEITGDSSKARAELTELRQSLAAVDRQNAEATVTVDTNAAEARIAALEAELVALEAMDPSVDVDVRIGSALSEIAALQAELAAVGRGTKGERIDIDAGPALAKLAALRSALLELDGASIDPRIRINVDQAKARIDELQAAFIRAKTDADNFSGPRFDDQGRVTDAYASKLREVSRVLKDLQTETNSTERAMRRWAEGMIDPADNLNKSFKGVLGVVKQINPVLQGLSLIIFTSLIPAFAGLIASAGAAAAGILSLGPAALTAGAAMGVGLIAVVKSIGDVLKVRQLREAASASATRQSAAADDRAEASARALAEAERAVRDAKQQRTAAARAVGLAEKQAADDIDAAQTNAADASADLKAKTVDAYRAMADAARDAKDAVLDLQDAQLSQREAALGTREAEKALKDFTKTGSKALQDLGRKFEDVSYDPKKLAGIIRSARSSGSVKGDDADKLEELTLRVERARLREKQAAQGVTDSETKLTQARERQAEFTKKGIAAYKPYVDAIQSARDAEAKYQALLKDGISGNPQVIAARESLRNANERIVESTQRVKDALKDQATALKGDSTGPMDIYKKKLADLTDAQRGFDAALTRASGPFETFKNLIADPVLEGFTSALDGVSGSLSKANGWASKLGQIGKKNIEDFLASLKADPKNSQALKIIGDESLKAARTLGGPAFQNFVRLMRNFATALLPLLNEGFRKLADSLGAAADRTDDWQALQDRMRPLLRLAGGFAGVIRQVIGAVVDLGRALEPVFTPFLKYIRDGIKRFREFTNSAKGGERMRKFFADVLPLVKSLITTVVLVGRVLLQAFQVVAPILKPILDVFNLLLGALSFILEKVLTIPAPIRALFSAFIPLGAITRGIGALGKLLGKLPGIAGLAFRAIGVVIRGIVTLIRPIVGFFEGIFLRIVLAARNASGAIAAPFRLLVRVVGTIVKGLVGVFAGGWEQVKAVFGPVASFFERVFGGVVSVVKGAFDGVISVVKGAINGLISAANFVIRAINAIPNIKTPFGSIGIPDIKEIPKLAKGGLVTGSTIANVGEAGDEAVIPLKTAVLAKLGAAIAAHIPGSKSTAGQRSTARDDLAKARQVVVNVSSPPGTNPDPVSTSKKIGRLVAAGG